MNSKPATAPPLPAEIEQIRERRLRATPLLDDTTFRIRYDHGGGRLYRQNHTTEPRDLIGDFYSEGDREFYFYAWADAKTLLAALAASQQRVAELESQILAERKSSHNYIARLLQEREEQTQRYLVEQASSPRSVWEQAMQIVKAKREQWTIDVHNGVSNISTDHRRAAVEIIAALEAARDAQPSVQETGKKE